MNGLIAKDFKPDDSGFFSKNLFKWLKKYPYYNRIYKSPYSSFGGYDPENPVLMIGDKSHDGWFSGNRLRSICCGHRMDARPYAFGHKEMRIDEWEDVTHQFIQDYKLMGVCAIHGDFAHRFKSLSKTEKICLNCGAVYKRKSKRVTKHFWAKDGE